jgi:hypothetical protein
MVLNNEKQALNIGLDASGLEHFCFAYGFAKNAPNRLHKLIFVMRNSKRQNYNMKHIIIISFLVFAPVSSFGQTELRKRKSIYLEIAGSGGLGSINFEKLFKKKILQNLHGEQA